jgi:hypothetical protein
MLYIINISRTFAIKDVNSMGEMMGGPSHKRQRGAALSASSTLLKSVEDIVVSK